MRVQNILFSLLVSFNLCLNRDLSKYVLVLDMTIMTQ